MLVYKTQVEMREKCEKNTRQIKKLGKTQANFSILHYALGKNASWLPFFSPFGMFEVTKKHIQRIV